MICPLCSHAESRVIQSGNDRRRRQCAHCRHRWTTVEVIDTKARAVEELAQAILKAARELEREEG